MRVWFHGCRTKGIRSSGGSARYYTRLYISVSCFPFSAFSPPFSSTTLCLVPPMSISNGSSLSFRSTTTLQWHCQSLPAVYTTLYDFDLFRSSISLLLSYLTCRYHNTLWVVLPCRCPTIDERLCGLASTPPQPHPAKPCSLQGLCLLVPAQQRPTPSCLDLLRKHLVLTLRSNKITNLYRSDPIVFSDDADLEMGGSGDFVFSNGQKRRFRFWADSGFGTWITSQNCTGLHQCFTHPDPTLQTLISAIQIRERPH